MWQSSHPGELPNLSVPITSWRETRRLFFGLSLPFALLRQQGPAQGVSLLDAASDARSPAIFRAPKSQEALPVGRRLQFMSFNALSQRSSVSALRPVRR